MKFALPLAVAAVLSLGFLPPASASSHFDLTQPGVIAVVDKQPFPARVVELLLQEARKSDAGITREIVTARLIENRLIGDYALKTYGDDTLFDNQRVGFRKDVELENQLAATLHATFGKTMDKGVSRLLQATHRAPQSVTDDQLDTVLGKKGRLMLGYDLAADKLELARHVELLTYRFPDGSKGSVTLGDVYDYQNVQGRVMIFNRDLKYLGSQANQLLERRATLQWVTQSGSLSAPELAFMRQSILDKARRDELTHYMGLDENLDEGTPYLKQMADSVTAQEVHDYYTAHKREFLQIDRVKMRHISLGSQQEADAVYESLQKGGDFAQLARQHSRQNADTGGDLGWVEYPKGVSVPWLSQLAFAQHPGTVSRPVRSPDAVEHWEIVLVDDRQQSYMPEDSGGVRFAVGQALARVKAAQSFVAIKEKVLNTGDIAVNPALINTAAFKL